MTTLRFVSAGAAQGLVKSLAAREGIAVEGQFGAVGAMWDALQGGAPCDIVILTRAQLDKLAAAGEVVAGTLRDIGLAPTSIAVKAGAPAPRIDTSEALVAALQASDAIYFPDPAKATAGIHFARVLRELGVHDALQPRFRTFPNGTTAMNEMARAAGSPIGCTQATEILAVPGVRLVAELPRDLSLRTLYACALHRRAREPEAARRFLEHIEQARASGEAARAGFSVE